MSGFDRLFVAWLLATTPLRWAAQDSFFGMPGWLYFTLVGLVALGMWFDFLPRVWRALA